MGLIGATSLAAHSIAIQIASLTFMIPLGLGMAATVRVGLAFGARDAHGVTRAGATGYALALGYALATAAAMIFFGRPLIGVFLDLDAPANAAVVDLAVTYLVFAGLFQLFDSGQALGAGTLRGLGDTRVPMVYAFIGYWGVGLPIAAWLGFGTGLAGSGIWIGLALGLAVVASLLSWRWLRRERLGLLRAEV